MNGRTFSQNPRKRGKRHHHHISDVIWSMGYLSVLCIVKCLHLCSLVCVWGLYVFTVYSGVFALIQCRLRVWVICVYCA